MSAPVVVSSGPQPSTASRLKLLDYEGQPIEGQTESEGGIEGFLEGAKQQPYAQARVTPWSWNASNPTQGMKVGWELRRKGKLEQSFAFSINPQSITRTETPRAQLYATQGGFYVDDFGAGAGTIQINQLVAGGHMLPNGFVTLREDILAFYNDIYLVAIGSNSSSKPLEVFFYDNHLFHGVRGAIELPEAVWFPPGGFSLERAVNLQNVWRFGLTMTALERPRASQGPPGGGSSASGTTVIIVRKSETLNVFARKHAGKSPSAKRVKTVEQAILKLNTGLKKARKVPIFSWQTGQQTSSQEVKAMRVLAGEKILIPS